MDPEESLGKSGGAGGTGPAAKLSASAQATGNAVLDSLASLPVLRRAVSEGRRARVAAKAEELKWERLKKKVGADSERRDLYLPVDLSRLATGGDTRSNVNPGMDLLGGVHSALAPGELLKNRRLIYHPGFGLTYDVWSDSPAEYAMSLASFRAAQQSPSINDQNGSFPPQRPTPGE